MKEGKRDIHEERQYGERKKKRKSEHFEDYCLTALTPCSLAEDYQYFI
jgi:hypothetical protein